MASSPLLEPPKPASRIVKTLPERVVWLARSSRMPIDGPPPPPPPEPPLPPLPPSPPLPTKPPGSSGQDWVWNAHQWCATLLTRCVARETTLDTHHSCRIT